VRKLLIIFNLVLALGGRAFAASPAAARSALESLYWREAALSQQIGDDRHALARLLSALELFSRDPPPPLLVSPSDAKGAVRAMILARAIAPALEVRAQALARQAQALAEVRRQAAVASGDLFAAESAIADRQGRLDAIAHDAALLNLPGAREPAGQGATAEPRLEPPVQGVVATRFGGKLQGGLRSRGLAYRVSPGAVVKSPADAQVVFAGPLSGWGQIIILRAAAGRHILLSGMGKVTVTPGQSVAATFPLGTMPTGGHLAPELYLEVRMAGGPVDPAVMMSGASPFAKPRSGGELLTRSVKSGPREGAD
jgi:septal ring factor EnvC (AmiA/AmiB activator)